jgi:LPS sulfotransferase NodH
VKRSYPGLRAELKTYLRFVVRASHQPDARFLIFGLGRSGSTLLASLLDSHPLIRCEDEILHHRVLWPWAYVRCRGTLFPETAYGFKLLLYQLEDVQRIRDAASFLRELHGSGFHILYLRRHNVLRHALSNLYARSRNLFHHRAGEGPLEVERMHVNPDELMIWMDSIVRATRREQDLLGVTPYLELVYEDDLQGLTVQQSTADRVAEYLGIATAPVTTNLVKLTPAHLPDFVSNHRELEQFVSRTAYRTFLET